MSEPSDPEIIVPAHLEGGVFANFVKVFDDIDDATMDFSRLDPRNPSIGFLVARVSAPASCILILKQRIEHMT